MGAGGGNFTGYPFAKFPGAYDTKDPGRLPKSDTIRISGLLLKNVKAT
jgi:hypothetical protein